MQLLTGTLETQTRERGKAYRDGLLLYHTDGRNVQSEHYGPNCE
jgi:hypothetical protein